MAITFSATICLVITEDKYQHGEQIKFKLCSNKTVVLQILRKKKKKKKVADLRQCTS